MESNLIVAILVIVAAQVAIALWLRASVRDGQGGGLPRLGALARGTGDQQDPRSYQAVASEVAKRQVAVLAEVAEELQGYDRACLAHARRVCEVMLAEWRRAAFEAVPEQLPNDLESAMRLLARLRERTLDAPAQARIRKDLEPNVTVLLSYAEQTTSRLEENRFWLGRALEQELRTYVTGMAAVFSELLPDPEALRAGEGRYRKLLDSHPEASRAIARLSASALANVGAA